LLAQVSLGQTPSLHPLRRRCSGFVRRLPWYYGSVRLPVFVHHGLPSLDLPMRPEWVGALLGRSRDLPTSVRDVSLRARFADRARLPDGSRYRRPGCGLPHRVNASASWSLGYFAAPSPWPVVPPVNASYLALRPSPHDSEPGWFVTPSPYDSCIRYIPPDSVPSAPGWRYDTSPRFGCCLKTKVAIRELPGNVETSNFSLNVARSRRLLVPIGELVDSAGRQFASTLVRFSQNQEVPNG
jgi:hypothetical protein